MEINSGSLRKLLDSYSIDQEISRTAERYSWCESYSYQMSVGLAKH